ncbi:primosome assembly protein PriA [Bartonella henselae]|uniref:Primosome assembly protein PriA n=1 Tax=Bartonella henselae TaxID=38323 RepID=X5MID8_BARHN|nr:primosome assembly protein PriA [Bartonella henselae]
MFSEKRQAAEHYARVLRQVAPGEKNISLMGLVEAPRAFVRGRYRFWLLYFFFYRSSALLICKGLFCAWFVSAPKMLFYGDIRYNLLLISLK